MDEPTDISYYLGSLAEQEGTLDVPLSTGQIVSINLVEDLPDDPNELVAFLDSEHCACKYWLSVASAYARCLKIKESRIIADCAINSKEFKDDDRASFKVFLVWLDLLSCLNELPTTRRDTLKKVGSDIKLIIALKPASSQVASSAILAQGVWCMAVEKNDEALIIFDRFLKQDPTNCFALMGKARIVLKKLKNYGVALKMYQQVLLLNPLMRPDPRIGIGLCYFFLKDHSIAIHAWERVLELDPDNVRARILLLLAQYNSACTESITDHEFKESYRKCLEAFADIHKSHPREVAVLLALASYFLSKGDLDATRKLVGRALQELTGDPEWNSKTRTSSSHSMFFSNGLSQCATFIGRIKFAEGDYIQASKYFQDAIKFNDANLLAKLALGQAQFHRGSAEEAIITYELILRSNSKCLEANYALGILYARQSSKRKQEQAIQVLERYVKLCNNHGTTAGLDGLAFLNREPVALNAYLVLSNLYELKDSSQLLTYLQKAIELRQQIGRDAPLEVYNNIGVLQFLKQNYPEAVANFEKAMEKISSGLFKTADGDVLMDLATDLKRTVMFNIARSKEVSKRDEAIETYQQLIQECPRYFSAKLRLLFLDCITNDRQTKQEIKDEAEQLLKTHASNLEVRSFYGWFVKNFGKKLGLKPDADTNHQKDTLVTYDSHDCYALISLANIYCIMARDIKGSDQDEKKQKYYIRAVELFAKVLSVDPKNVYAAQGLAIAFIENKELLKGLDILRKIRDSLNDISVYLNLGHVCVELKEYGKAIENYTLALTRFTDERDSRILSFLGRAWLLRAVQEKAIDHFKQATRYARKALEYATGSHSLLKFNLAYLHFQTAEFVTKLPLTQRNVGDTTEALENLKEAVDILTALALDEEGHAPYPKADLKARASLGETTLHNRLTNCLEETRQHHESIAAKLEDAQKVRSEEEKRRLEAERSQREQQLKREQDMAQERAKLHEQAQIWAEESRMNVADDGDGPGADDESVDEEGNTKKRKRSKNTKKQTRNKKKEWEELDEESAPQKSKSKKRRVVSDDDEEREDADAGKEESGAVSRRKSKRKTAPLSKEFLDDSDSSDGMFGKDDEEADHSGLDN